MNLIVFVEVGHCPVGVGDAHAVELCFQVEETPAGRPRDLFQARRVMKTVKILHMDCNLQNGNGEMTAMIISSAISLKLKLEMAE